jgi:hypothetical protein
MLRIRAFRHLLAVALAAAPAVFAQVPDGKISINYNRCDNNYDGWGVHLWKSPSTPLPGVSWSKPLMPTGKSDFGVAWQADLAEFGNSGTVNYIIHKGDTKEQGGKDMSFDGKANKEAWVNSGDRKIYFSLDDAKKGRDESPCK